MSELIFNNVFAEQTIQSETAKKYWEDYPAFNTDESWRWTPLSALRGVQRGLSFADYQSDCDEAITESFTENAQIQRILQSKEAPFAAVNIALLQKTLTFRVPAGAHVEEPIAINIDALGKKWQFSQIAIELEKDAKATFWIDLQGQRGCAQNCVIALDIAENAQLEGIIWQSANDAAANVALTYVASHQGANSHVNVMAIQNGCALSRLDIDAHLDAKNAVFNFGGLQLGKAENAADYHVQVRHHKESGESRQIVRGVLSDQSSAIFDGLIYVAEGAQLTDARQNSRFIMLSEQAKAQSVPRLEIYADDVQCAHGSTMGFIDKEALFYMRSRGISYQQAQQLLLMSFLQEAIVVQDTKLKSTIEEAVRQLWLGESDA